MVLSKSTKLERAQKRIQTCSPNSVASQGNNTRNLWVIKPKIGNSLMAIQLWNLPQLHTIK